MTETRSAQINVKAAWFKMKINDLLIVKKDGSFENFKEEKIRLAVSKSASRTDSDFTEEKMAKVISLVEQSILWRWEDLGKKTTPVKDVHQFVEVALSHVDDSVYLSYKSYRDYKKKQLESFQSAAKFSNKVVYDGDKENANKDSSINSTKQALIGETYMKELMKNFEMNPKWIEAHEEGFIHIHDLGSRYLNQINCCLFDMENVLSGGFEMNGVKYSEPTNIRSAWNVIGDVTLNASSQQYGGFTIGEIDSILSKYAKKTFDKYFQIFSKQMRPIPAKIMAKDMTLDDIAQGYQGFEHKLNTVSNALGQTPFVTITFGVDVTMWGKEIAKAILSERTKGMGEEKVTAVFPKLVFMYKNEINGNEDSPNHDLFLKSVECSRTRLYPDYLSYENTDNNLLARINEDTGKFLVPMGCRAFLSRAKEPYTQEEIYTGRNNIGAVTLNIPKLAKMAAEVYPEDKEMAMEFLKVCILHYSKMVWDIHLNAYEKIGKMKGSTNPLMFCEGGAWRKVGYNEPIAPILELSTASLGFVGLEEAAAAFDYHFKDIDFESFKHEVMDYLEEVVNAAREDHGKLFALYATPAESLVYRFQNINREESGVIKGYTDKDYMTNSFHVHVAKEINAIDKITTESSYHNQSAGGRITYTEFPYAVDSNVLIDSIKYAMDKGLYYGVNVVSSSCCDCGHKGDFEVCPECSSNNVTTVVRVCGYLTFKQSKGDTRLNKGKLSETNERVKHSYI